jgi:hypothetical protein
MHGDASLARLIREHGDRWVFERFQRGAEWVAVRSEDPVTHIVGARDLAGLRDQMEAAEREDAEAAGAAHSSGSAAR